MLTGFETLILASGTPYMTVTKNGASFNKSCVEKMEMAPYVLPLIDRAGKRFAIVHCDMDEPGAQKFFRGRDISNGVRWGNTDFLTTVSEIVGVSYGEGFRVNASFDPDERALIFDLSDPLPVRGSK